MSPRNSQFSRDEIISAAVELVRTNGWDGFSVTAVAKAVNASTMPIYSHFSNIRELEDAVRLEALELLKKRMCTVQTGDVWIDQGINFVRFAEEELFLFRCLWDGRNVELCRTMAKDLNDSIAASLADYPLFKGLDELELRMIRTTRMMFAQKLAYWLNINSDYLTEKGITDTDDYIRRATMAIYDGFALQFMVKR